MFLDELLNTCVIPYTPSSLIDVANFQKIAATVNQFPEKITSFFGFECRLGQKQPAADVLLCIAAAEYGRSILAGASPIKAIPSQWAIAPAWEKVLKFANSWNDSASELYAWTDYIWLEFDVAENGLSAIPIPSIFFAPFDQKNKTHLKGDLSTTIILESLETIQGKTLNPIIVQQLRNVEKALPDTAYIFQVGTMLAREVDAYRICIKDISILEVIPFLQKVGWKGNIDALKENLNKIDALIDRICLDIDVGTSIGNKIGLECYQEYNESIIDNWKPFLHFLEKEQLCTIAKKQGLLDYFGNIHAGMVEEGQWPEHLKQLSSIIGSRYLSMYIREINHIKLNFDDSRFTEAKAYLGVRHVWANIATLRKIFAKNHLKMAV